MQPQRWPLVAALGLALATLLLVGLAALGADVNPDCLTKAQAKAKWPKAWLYWHTADHCWDNRPGRRHGLHRQHGTKAMAQDDVKRKKSDRLKFVSPDDYNELDAATDKDAFFRAEPLQLWPPIIQRQPHARFIPWEERIGTLK
jgi:hypothetical protein